MIRLESADDTIAAIATPIGEGGLAVIRLSGPRALAIADHCFQPAGPSKPKPSTAPTHTIHYGHIVDHPRIIDEVLLSVLRAPRTFTREDTVEISCHGGLLPAKLVLDCLLRNGARLAQPGEFTRRAFLNGRIDLTQAEAVADIIHSKTELALAAANEQLAGHLSHHIHQLRDSLMSTLAHIEAHIDFPDEDIAPDTYEALSNRIESSLNTIHNLLRTAPEGQLLRRGIRAVIIGRPNAGKSSLLNLLLGHNRAIVSPIAGTTRDTIAETANIRGLPIIFVDTAGLRESEDVIEREGIRRSHEALQQAELVLHLIDASQPLTESDREYLTQASARRWIVILNKTDLLNQETLTERHRELGTLPAPIQISCQSLAGIERLKDEIRDRVWSGAASGEMSQVTINARHQDALRRAQEALTHTLEAMHHHASLELVALDLRIAIGAVGEIVGKTSTDDLLDSIFSQFCLGK